MHPHRSSALGYASAASAVHSRVYGACTAEAAASETSGLSVGGCIRAWADFRPYPVVIRYCTVLYNPHALLSTCPVHLYLRYGTVGRLGKHDTRTVCRL